MTCSWPTQPHCGRCRLGKHLLKEYTRHLCSENLREMSSSIILSHRHLMHVLIYFDRWVLKLKKWAITQCAPVTSEVLVRGPLRRCLWRFISRLLTVKTVYLSWLAWPRNTWCRLTDFEWDVKEPLRTTRRLAVITHIASVSDCMFHIHAGRRGAVTATRDFRSRGVECGSRLSRCGAVSLGKALHL